MMILIAAVLSTPQAVTPPPVDQDIVVVGERLRRIRLRLDRRKGVLRRCQVRVSSGDGALDEYACRATAECMASNRTRRRDLEACLTEKTIVFARARRASGTPATLPSPSEN